MTHLPGECLDGSQVEHLWILSQQSIADESYEVLSWPPVPGLVEIDVIPEVAVDLRGVVLRIEGSRRNLVDVDRYPPRGQK
ncbi:hypothetical protein I7860_02330 [Pseudomonas tolaasii]|uniref:hypothetical protein n=1 Tax=Pseudomonas tolaasii TaxID=29442 RepID=UPI001C58649F|nr:hypothetical protein [Pseudomonas tolaasii]MBW1245509.1 hypothetical protein [Pseudomonas tolaasii]